MQETKCSTLGSARRDCDGPVSYAKRETTPKVTILVHDEVFSMNDTC